MVQSGSVLRVCDKSGCVFVQCIRVVGSSSRKIGFLGDVLIVSIQKINPKRVIFLKGNFKRQYKRGSIHRVLVVRSKVNFLCVGAGYIKFDENAVAFVTRNYVPFTNKVFGPVLRFIATKYPSFGCVSQFLL